MIAKSYVTISLTRDEFIKVLADAVEAQYDPDHPMHWFASRLMNAADGDDVRSMNAEIRKRHNILTLGELKPGAAA